MLNDVMVAPTLDPLCGCNVSPTISYTSGTMMLFR
jgi:hypothetical protein